MKLTTHQEEITHQIGNVDFVKEVAKLRMQFCHKLETKFALVRDTSQISINLAANADVEGMADDVDESHISHESSQTKHSTSVSVEYGNNDENDDTSTDYDDNSDHEKAVTHQFNDNINKNDKDNPTKSKTKAAKTEKAFYSKILLSISFSVLVLSIFGIIFFGKTYNINKYNTTIFIDENMDVHVTIKFDYSIHSHVKKYGYKSIGLLDYTITNVETTIINKDKSKMSFEGPEPLGDDTVWSYVKYSYDSDFDITNFPYNYQFEISYVIKNDISASSNPLCFDSSRNRLSLFLSWFNKFSNFDLINSSTLSIYCHNGLYHDHDQTQLSSSLASYFDTRMNVQYTTESMSNSYTRCFHLNNNAVKYVHDYIGRHSMIVYFENVDSNNIETSSIQSCQSSSFVVQKPSKHSQEDSWYTVWFAVILISSFIVAVTWFYITFCINRVDHKNSKPKQRHIRATCTPSKRTHPKKQRAKPRTHPIYHFNDNLA